ncbi:type I restriction enzyme endonuclease domain-containing protein [Micromonospora sp. NBC_01405]|uniref:type I restriction enzyme endonuclease domain-containing protein n=1 Tax=Micromonospora sp. NBC_01405 TaxID=2903589 RepID=UPI00386B7310
MPRSARPPASPYPTRPSGSCRRWWHRRRPLASIKRLLVRYKYPPDKQPEAIRLVLVQMEALEQRSVVQRTAG